MQYFLDGEQISVAVESKGAEICSIYNKKTQKEILWQADPDIWDRHAPLLFPHCGNVWDKQLTVQGRAYPAAQHGFARDFEFACVRHDKKALVFRLQSSPLTQNYYPYQFVLEVEYTLSGNILQQQVRVINKDNQLLPFTLGFHPGFALPFGGHPKTTHYQVVFEVPESPMEIETVNGYVSGKKTLLFENQKSMELSPSLFEVDSICLTGLKSRYIDLCPVDAGNETIRVYIEGFPYVLLWAPAVGTLPLLCIEPWHGLPDGPQRYGEFENKPGQTLLQPGKTFDTALTIELL